MEAISWSHIVSECNSVLMNPNDLEHQSQRDGGSHPGEQGAAERPIAMMDIVRYAKGANHLDVMLEGYPNFHYLTRPDTADAKRMLLESGVNRVAKLLAPDGWRRPAILLRSSPWKSGHETNPWEDVYDLDHGHVRYFGDHKPSSQGPVGVTPGNRSLLDAWDLHGSPNHEDRASAPPILLFRAVPVLNAKGHTVQKGYVEFCGAAVIERMEMVIQRESRTSRTFPNLVVDLVVIDLADNDDMLDWRWIDHRRDPAITSADALKLAPASWRRWVRDGRMALPRIRRRVLSSRVITADEQRPAPGSSQRALLEQIYSHFDGKKHEFEQLAATVAAQVFEGSGAKYHRGWLTRAGGDGGMDFIGRLDAGSRDTSTPLVVLGQAKCINPTTSVSPDEVALWSRGFAAAGSGYS